MDETQGTTGPDDSQVAQAAANNRSDELVRPQVLSEHGISPSFSVVSDLFERFTASAIKAGGKSKKGISIAEKRKGWIQDTFEQYRSKVGLDLFPLVRLLVPDRDRQRNTYGAKEQVLAKAYVGAMGLRKDAGPAQRLLHWKQPRQGEPGAGDFAEVVMREVKDRTTVIGRSGNMTIEQVNTALDQLARAGSEVERVRVIRIFYDNLTEVENKWLVRIILKDLKISIRERTVLAVLHPDAMDLFNVCSDLRRVCWTLYDPTYRLPHEDSTVKIFMSFRPMLCKRNDNDKKTVVKSMGHLGNNVQTDGFIMEEKLDGERIQLHKRGEEFRYYSRKDKDYTYLYGKSRLEGSLTPFIHHLIHSDIEEIVLDGEMLAYDPIGEKVLPFGTLKTAALDKSMDSNKPRPVFKVFDVLYAKGKRQAVGQTLIAKKLSARKEFIRRFTKQSVGRLEWAEMRTGKTDSDISDYLTEILERFGEGLVIKNPRSTYVLNGREDSWIKVKPEYADDLGENFDLIVIGGFWGSGRRGGYFGSFFCGIAEDVGGERVFKSFCKVGSGLSLDILNHIKQTTDGLWQPFPKDKRNPPGLFFGAERPDEWIHPHNSFFLGIKAAEVVNDAKNYGAGVCLRFPRIIWYDRERKHKPEDCMTLEEFVAKRGTGKRKAGEEDMRSMIKKRKVKKDPVVATYAEAYRGADVSGVERESEILGGMMFWVLEGTKEPGQSKNELERLLYLHGGDYCQSVPKADDRAVVCDRTDFLAVQSAMKRGESIIKPQWVIDSVSQKRRLPFSDNYYAFKADETYRSPIKETRPLPKSRVKKEDDLLAADLPASETESDEDMDDVKPLPNKGKGKYREPTVKEEEEEEAASQSETESEVSVPSDPESDQEGFKLIGFAKNSGRGMGRDVPNADAQYGEETTNLFKHLFFYLDTLEAASSNNLPTEPSTRAVYDEPWRTVNEDILRCGGQIVGIKDDRLTHVVLWPGDTTRSKQTFHLTNKEPRHKHFVTTTWVTDSVTNGELLPENLNRPVI